MAAASKTATPTVAELEEREAEAMVQVAAARAARDALRREAEGRRDAALREHDGQALAQWMQHDRDQLEADITAAQARLREALLADPAWQAYAGLVLAGHRRALRHAEAASLDNRLNGTTGWSPTPSYAELGFGDLAAMVVRAATERGRAEQDARDQSREAAGQAAVEDVR